ncbi:amidohydrolase family protein [Microbispora sp. RL4-1S]|uniref:Amidohydrolase family protein n=1 Tax=Microbispora oryzae TaxID=2806554 RepID=A0A940WSN2_9ACTN|nr:amidohydrolase family protein [Microbispora oryzae]MBP2708678.1 amidohydrolase family protein [Microbispora oryzae]
MTYVDAHHHTWELARRPQSWLEPPEMAPINRDFTLADYDSVAAKAEISRSVLVQVLPDAEETREFLALAAGPGTVAAVVGWADLTRPDLADELAALAASPGGELLRGIRHLVQAEPDPRWLSRDDVRAGLRRVAEAGLSYDVLVKPHQLPSAIETVRALPELSFVLDHLAKPDIVAGELEPWAGLIRELAAEPNVTAKLSGIITEATWDEWDAGTLRPYVDVALDAFGPGRLMFGSDWPVCLLAGSLPVWAETARTLLADAGLSGEETDAVLRGTAERAYRL